MNGVDTSTPVVVAKLVPELFDYQGLGIVRSLGRLGIRVLGCHDSLRAPAAASRYDADPQVFAGSADKDLAGRDGGRISSAVPIFFRKRKCEQIIRGKFVTLCGISNSRAVAAMMSVNSL